MIVFTIQIPFPSFPPPGRQSCVQWPPHLNQFLSSIMLRKDLRSPLQSRALSSELGVVLEADGSAQITMGSSKIVASVVGPTQPKYGRHELFDRASVDVEVELSSSVTNNGMDKLQQKKNCEAFLKESLATCMELQQFPRLLILFKVLVVSNDGSMFAVALNTCILALLDAGLPMKFVPNAVSLCSSHKNNSSELFLDASLEEESEATANYTFTIKPVPVNNTENSLEGEILVSNCSGSFSMDILNNAISAAMEASQVVQATMRNVVEAKMGSAV